MVMNEDAMKVRLSPSDGRNHGVFDEGMPIAEAMGSPVSMQIDTTNGERIRYFGVVTAVMDVLENIDNTEDPDKQVVSTTIFLSGMPAPIVLSWRHIAMAFCDVGEVQ